MAGAEGPFPGARSRLPCRLPQRKAAPWAQGPPSTSPHQPWAPASSSPCAWGPLDETVATVFQEGRGSSVAPPPTRRPASGTAPRVPQWLRGGKASRRPAGGTGSPGRAAQALPEPHKGAVDCQVWCEPFFPSPRPCPGSLDRRHLFCTEPRGRGREGACTFDSCLQVLSNAIKEHWP